MDHSMQNFPVLDLSEIASRETDKIRSILEKPFLKQN